MIYPHVIQLETHPYYVDRETMDTFSPYGTKLMGWYPLGHGNWELLGEPVFEKLSEKFIRARFGKSSGGLLRKVSLPFREAGILNISVKI